MIPRRAAANALIWLDENHRHNFKEGLVRSCKCRDLWDENLLHASWCKCTLHGWIRLQLVRVGNLFIKWEYICSVEIQQQHWLKFKCCHCLSCSEEGCILKGFHVYLLCEEKIVCLIWLEVHCFQQWVFINWPSATFNWGVHFRV